MGKARLVLHPVLTNKRSRYIFLIYLGVSMMVGALSWFKLESALNQAHVSVFYGPPTSNLLLSIMLSPHFRIGLIFASAVLAAGITAHAVIGPVRRIQQWLENFEQGQSGLPLKVRGGDKFSRLVDLINRLCR